MPSDPRTIASAFQIQGDLVPAEPFGTGHINDSYALAFDHAGRRARFLLQRINHEIFTDVPALMSNIGRVCTHVRSRLAAQGVRDLDRRVLTPIPTREGSLFHRDSTGSFWRIFTLIEGARGYERAASPQQAYTAARAFGAFQRLLSDLPGDRLAETIPNFHHTPTRYAAFDEAVKQDRFARVAHARREVEWFLEHRELGATLIRMRDNGLAPQRVTHNDTKLNNVLIDDLTHEAICVVDLDTVMPGLSLYDFGDLVRTATSPTAEDEKDITKVDMQMPLFDALARGYLDETRSFLTPAEVENLPVAGMVITLTIGLRFLTDFLQGDTYYKTHRPGHNLDRCRTQIALVDSMKRQEALMRDCVAAIMRRG